MKSRMPTPYPALIIWLILCLGASAAVADTPGESGILSLRMPVGARETAMGGAGVASARGAAAVFWNPALLALEERHTDLLLQHQSLYGGLFDKETALLAHRTGKGVIGFMFSGLYSDEITRYGETNVGIPEGSFEPYQTAFGATYSKRLGETFAVGMGLKLIHEEIDVYGDTGFAYDVSVAHKAKVDGLVLGAALTNVGPDLTVNTRPYALPTALRVGFSFDPRQALFAGRVSLAGDLVFPNDGNEKAHAGVEFRLASSLALQLGTRINYESQGLTAGFRVEKGDLHIGYAFEDLRNDLGQGHWFVLGLDFGSSGS